MVKLTTKLVLRKSSSSKSISRTRLNKTKEKANNVEQENEAILTRLTHLHLQENFISEIGDISICRNLTVLYLQHNHLTSISNLQHSVNLSQLYLQHNKIDRIQNLHNLKKLRKLYLGHNCIAVVEGLEGLPLLEELHLEKQRLQPGETLHFDPRTIRSLAGCVKSLNVSSNNLSTLSDLSCLRELQLLDAQHNNLSEVSEVEEAVAGWMYLTTVTLVGNPVCSRHKYKERVVAAASWSLESLDGKTVSDSSRSFLKKFEQKLAMRNSSTDATLDRNISPNAGLGVRGKSGCHGDTTSLTTLQMHVTGGRLSVPDVRSDTYVAWRAFNGASNRGILPFTFQRQAERRAGGVREAFTAHLPSL